jgi:abortive infection bacteriophage resistance protein
MTETVKKNIHSRIHALDNKGLLELRYTISTSKNMTQDERNEFYDAIDKKMENRELAMVEFGETREGAEPEDR